MSTKIDEIEAWIGHALPAAYRIFVGLHADDIAYGDVCLYGASEILDLNEVHHIKEYCPGQLAIGSDGGSRQFLLCLNTGQISRVADDDLGGEEEFISADFAAWLAEGCPVPSEPEPAYDHSALVAVYLEKPLKSVKTLLLIKDQLAIPISIAEFKKLAQTPPCKIADHLSYAQAIHRCAKVNQVENCLEIHSLDDPSVRLPLQ